MNSDTVPAALFVLVCEALETAQAELETLDGTDAEAFPVPDALQALLEQRAAAVAVLGRLRKADPRKLARLTAEQWNAHLTAAWDEERAKADADYVMPGAPVDKDVLQQLDEAHEVVRRSSLSDRGLADTLRAVSPKGWAW